SGKVYYAREHPATLGERRHLRALKCTLCAENLCRTIYDDIFASLDWLPTLVEIAGGPKGNDLKAQIEKGSYKGIVKTTLDGVNQIDYRTGKSGKSARDVFFYYAGPEPSAVRYKNWKLIFAIAPETAFGFAQGVQHQYMAAVINLKRDPFETSWGDWMKAGFG